MANETSKTKRLLTEEEMRILTDGRGIDIGAGSDPVTPDVYVFDLLQGDANNIRQYVNDEFDFVFSSHCLEHMYDPRKALFDWWTLVKPGGYLFLVVPDEDLYEQGVFPSRFNSDHKWTFTISKNKSWSNRSINLYSLICSLPNSKILKMELQDNGYDRNLGNQIDQSRWEAMCQIFALVKKVGQNEREEVERDRIALSQTLYQQALNFHQQKQLGAALLNYSEAIELNPELAEAWVDRGVLYMHVNQKESALADFNKAIELKPDWSVAYSSRGVLYMQSGENRQAEKDLNKAIELNPNFVHAYINRSLLHIQSGENRRAIEDLSKAIELNSNFAHAHYNRALLYMQSGENRRAIQDLSKVVAQNPGSYNAHKHLGIAHIHMQQIHLALTSLGKALLLNPDSSEAYTYIGMAFAKNRQFDLALEYGEKAIELNPNNARAYAVCGSVLSHLHQHESATKYLDRARSLEPDFVFELDDQDSR